MFILQSQKNMRSKNAIKNLLFLLIQEIVAFALGIIFPRYIIVLYGSEINGLTATITRVLALVNLIQAGAVGAAIYQMYKPVADKDYDTQSAIIYSSRKFYNIISVVYLSLSLAAGVFYGFYLKNDGLSFLAIFLSFFILALNGANILLFNSICDIFISPHQKKYLISFASICEQIVRYGLMTVVLVLKLPFIFIYLCYLAGGFVSVVLNLLFYKILSKNIISKNPSNKSYVIPGKKYLMLASIGSEMVTASPTIIITTIIDLVHTSIFSVYAMIFTSMKTILNSIQLSFSAIFGNLTKTADNKKIYEVHSSIELLTIALGAIASSCVGFLIIPFIRLYTAGADANYEYTILAIFVVAYTVFFTFRTSYGYVATVYGLFKDTCKIILIFGIIGITISIVCTILFGMPYVMVGLLFNQLGCAITTLLVIKKKVSWFKLSKLFVRAGIMSFLAFSFTLLFFVFEPKIDGWVIWILYGLIIAISVGFLFTIYCIIFERKCVKILLTYVGNLFKRKRNRIS